MLTVRKKGTIILLATEYCNQKGGRNILAKITLAAARVNAGFTQEQLAERIGVTRKTYANWENGKTKIKPGFLYAFCVLTGFSVDDILLPKEYA